MGKKGTPRSAYTEQFKQEALELYDQVGLAAAARKLGVAGQTLHTWIGKRKNGLANGATAPSLTGLQLENRQLKAALAIAEMERDILKKATAYFAKHAR